MARYPLYYTEEIEIHPDDILDYVKENKEWFLEQINATSKEEYEDLIRDL